MKAPNTNNIFTIRVFMAIDNYRGIHRQGRHNIQQDLLLLWEWQTVAELKCNKQDKYQWYRK